MPEGEENVEREENMGQEESLEREAGTEKKEDSEEEVSLEPEEDMGEEEEPEEELPEPAIFTVKTTIGQEKAAADMIMARSKNFDLPVKSVLSPHGIKGYVFVEAQGGTTVEQARAGIKHAKGVIRGEVPFKDLEHLLIPQPAVSGIEMGDIVELTAGPFKGERAKIIRIDEGKEEITVEFFEATVPIPVTVRGDHVKMVERRKEGE